MSYQPYAVPPTETSPLTGSTQQGNTGGFNPQQFVGSFFGGGNDRDEPRPCTKVQKGLLIGSGVAAAGSVAVGLVSRFGSAVGFEWGLEFSLAIVLAMASVGTAGAAWGLSCCGGGGCGSCCGRSSNRPGSRA